MRRLSIFIILLLITIPFLSCVSTDFQDNDTVPFSYNQVSEFDIEFEGIENCDQFIIILEGKHPEISRFYPLPEFSLKLEDRYAVWLYSMNSYFDSGKSKLSFYDGVSEHFPFGYQPDYVSLVGQKKVTLKSKRQLKYSKLTAAVENNECIVTFTDLEFGLSYNSLIDNEKSYQEQTYTEDNGQFMGIFGIKMGA